MNVKTVSDLISKLGKASLIETTVDKQQANRRILMPSASQMPPYPEKPDSPLATPKVSARNPAYCIITGLDITTQQGDHP